MMRGVTATTIGPELDWRLAVAVGVLTAATVAASRVGRLGTALPSVRAIVRAVLQLLAVALVVTAALEHVWSSLLFVVFMFGVATFTASGRVDARSSFPWIAASIGVGAVPVLLIVFGLGAAPFEPPTIVAIGGIVIGNAMTAFTLMGRRSLAALRERFGEVEAALSLGFVRRRAMALVVDHDRPEALVPVLDQTRTVGLVSLPGAFIGVLLGGGSAADAAAAQLIVLVGLVAAQTVTVVVGARLVAAGRILDHDLRDRLPAA